MRFSSKIRQCGFSPMRKYNSFAEKAARNGVKVYHLNIGQPDVQTPAAFRDALHGYDEEVLSYAPSGGLPEYVDAVRAYYKRIGVCLEPEEILPAAGGSEALQIAFTVLLDDGDEILVPEPFYPNYSTFITLTGAVIHPIPTYVEESYFYADRQRIEAEINEHTRALLITNPGNPTGAVLSPEQLRMLLDIAREHQLFLVCDEVYREFVYAGEPLLSGLQFDGYEENVIVIDSSSKRFSACGARMGAVISRNHAFMEEAMKCCQGRLASSTVDQIGAAALFRMDPAYFASVREEYHRRRDIMVSKLQQIPGVICREPKGAFYVMCALPVDDADRFQLWLLEEYSKTGETVLMAPGQAFYATPGRGLNEVRLAYTINAQDIAHAIDLLKDALDRYNR